MAIIIKEILLIFVLTTDSFVVSFAYGMRKVKMPFKIVAGMNVIMSGLLGLSLLTGGFLSGFLSEDVTMYLGAILLISIGLYRILSFFFQKEEKQEEQIAEKVEDKDRNQQEVQNQTESEKEAAADTPAHQSYTIQPGDTMTRISVKNYSTIKKIKEICELNNMSETDTIYPGQIILLP